MTAGAIRNRQSRPKDVERDGEFGIDFFGPPSEQFRALPRAAAELPRQDRGKVFGEDCLGRDRLRARVVIARVQVRAGLQQSEESFA